MTIIQLLVILRRRWYVVTAGFICSVAAILVFSESERVYFSQAAVVFQTPGAPTVAGMDNGFSESLISFAAIVERTVNNGSESVRLASPTATLYGIGVHRGKSVVLADRGGQWVHSFDRPVLSIQVADSSPERVTAVLAETISEITTAAEAVQSASGAPADTWIKSVTVPERPEIAFFGQTLTSKAKGIASMGAVGFGLTAAAACLVDRYALRFRRRRHEYVLSGG